MLAPPGKPHSPVTVLGDGGNYRLIVSGHGFGNRMGSVSVLDSTDSSIIIPVTILSWNDHEVVVQVPNVASGSIVGISFSTAGYLGDRSPDNCDALVFALSDLIVEPHHYQ